MLHIIFTIFVLNAIFYAFALGFKADGSALRFVGRSIAVLWHAACAGTIYGVLS